MEGIWHLLWQRPPGWAAAVCEPGGGRGAGGAGGGKAWAGISGWAPRQPWDMIQLTPWHPSLINFPLRDFVNDTVTLDKFLP